MTTTLAAPVTSITLAALTPDVVRSCVVLQPSPPPEPGEEPPEAIGDDDIYTPVAPGVTYAGLPTVTIVDTSPDQLIGCIIDTADNPQGRLNALFPAAIDGDGVIERSTNDIWVYDGSEWNNVGPTPGPTIVTATIIPPWNEILTYEARIRTRLLAQSLAYALQLLTEPDPFVVRATLEAKTVTAVKVPSTALTLQSAVPQVSISARVNTPVLSTQISALPLSVASGAAVITPAISTSVTGVTPDLIGRLRISISVPASDTELTPTAPSVATGAVVSVPVRDIGLSAVPPAILDSDAAAYITAVEAADTQSLETGVKLAINDFVVGCKDDGIWNAIKASCILAGARTLTGALTPLVGAAPTNFNFVSGDYNRKTGLKGDGSTKYLNSNRNNNADPQDSCHLSVYLGGGTTIAATEMLIGCRGSDTANTHDIFVSAGNAFSLRSKTSNSSFTATISRTSPGLNPEFLGVNRASSAGWSARAGSNTATATNASASFSAEIDVFRRNDLNAGSSLFTNARLAFYSIGESLDLALLDARVTTLIADIDAAIT